MRSAADTGGVSGKHSFAKSVHGRHRALLKQSYGFGDHVTLGPLLQLSQFLNDGRIDNRLVVFIIDARESAPSPQPRHMIAARLRSILDVLAQHESKLLLGEGLAQVADHPGV